MADVEFEVPTEWASTGNVDSSAVQRANGWTSAVGGKLVRAEGSSSVDNYVETLALIEINRPLPDEAIASEEGAQAFAQELLGNMVGGATPEELELVPLGEDGVNSIQAEYLVGEERLRAIVIPDGTLTHLIVIGTLDAEKILYAPIVTQIVNSISGGSTPVTPFDLSGFRTKYIVAWLFCFVGAFFASIAVFSERKGDYKRTGGFAALMLVALAILAALTIWASFGDTDASLKAAGTSLNDLISEVFGFGALGAVIIFGLSQVLQSDDGPIQSAPTASTIFKAPLPHAPPPSQAPPESEAPEMVEAIELPEFDEEAQTVIKSLPSKPRTPPPPSSTARRVATTPVKRSESRPANLQDAREEPPATVKIPSRPTGKGPKS